MIRMSLLLLFLMGCSSESLRPTIPPSQVLPAHTEASTSPEPWNPSLAQAAAVSADQPAAEAEPAGRGDVLDFVEAMRSFNGRTGSKGARPLGADSDGLGFSRPAGAPGGRPMGSSRRPAGVGGPPSGQR